MDKISIDAMDKNNTHNIVKAIDKYREIIAKESLDEETLEVINETFSKIGLGNPIGSALKYNWEMIDSFFSREIIPLRETIISFGGILIPVIDDFKEKKTL